MPISKNRLKKLYYDKKMSISEIADFLDCSYKKVYYWFKKYSIERRTLSQSAYIKQNPEGDPFNIKQGLDKDDLKLLLVGIIIYWSEGNKQNRSVVQIVNLDERMIRLFKKFLDRICNVNQKKIKLYVRVYGEYNNKKIKKYWSNYLNIPINQIRIYPHNDKRSNPDKQWSKHGIATLQVANTKLKKWMDRTVDNYINQLLFNEKDIWIVEVTRSNRVTPIFDLTLLVKKF